MFKRRLVRVVAALMLGGLFALHLTVGIDLLLAYALAYREGASEAATNIRLGRARLYYYYPPDMLGRLPPDYDEDTGLPHVETDVGGVSRSYYRRPDSSPIRSRSFRRAEAWTEGHVDGHNAAIRDFVKQHGFPRVQNTSPCRSDSRCRYSSFGSYFVFVNHSRALTLPMDGSHLQIPGHDVALSLISNPVGIRVTSATVEHLVSFPSSFPSGDRIDLVPLPPGSGHIAFKVSGGQLDRREVFGVLDATRMTGFFYYR